MLKAEQPLILLYSSRKERFSGFDGNGKATFTKYDGERNDVIATIADLKLVKTSPSIAVEDDTVFFTLVVGQVIPNKPGCRSINLHFDEHSLFESKAFKKGDAWRITLTEGDELVNLRPVIKDKAE